MRNPDYDLEYKGHKLSHTYMYMSYGHDGLHDYVFSSEPYFKCPITWHESEPLTKAEFQLFVEFPHPPSFSTTHWSREQLRALVLNSWGEVSE